MAERDKAPVGDETRALIAADRISGTAVHTPAGEKLGTVETIVIGKVSGVVEYAVLALGGAGMGKSRCALPWDALTYNTDQNAYVADLDPEVLKNDPIYDEEVDEFDPKHS